MKKDINRREFGRAALIILGATAAACTPEGRAATQIATKFFTPTVEPGTATAASTDIPEPTATQAATQVPDKVVNRGVEAVKANVDRFLRTGRKRIDDYTEKYGYLAQSMEGEYVKPPVVRVPDLDSGTNEMVYDRNAGTNSTLLQNKNYNADLPTGLSSESIYQGINLGTASLTDRRGMEHDYLFTGHSIPKGAEDEKVVLTWSLGFKNKVRHFNSAFAFNGEPPVNQEGHRIAEDKYSLFKIEGGIFPSREEGLQSLDSNVGRVLAFKSLDGSAALMDPPAKVKAFADQNPDFKESFFPDDTEFDKWADQFSSRHGIPKEQVNITLAPMGKSTANTRRLVGTLIEGDWHPNNSELITRDFAADPAEYGEVSYEKAIEVLEAPQSTPTHIIDAWKFPMATEIRMADDTPLSLG